MREDRPDATAVEREREARRGDPHERRPQPHADRTRRRARREPRTEPGEHEPAEVDQLDRAARSPGQRRDRDERGEQRVGGTGRAETAADPPGGRGAPQLAERLLRGQERPTDEHPTAQDTADQRAEHGRGEGDRGHHERGEREAALGRQRGQLGELELARRPADTAQLDPHQVAVALLARDVAPGVLERAQRPARDHLGAVGDAARPRHAAGVEQGYDRRGDLGEREQRVLGHEPDQRPEHPGDQVAGAEERQQQHGGGRKAGVHMGLAARAERAAGVGRGRDGGVVVARATVVGHAIVPRQALVVAQAVVGRLGVPHGRGGDDDDPVPCQPGPPGQVETVAERAEARVGAAERVPHVAAHQRAGQADGEHVVAPVVLALVDLALLDARHPAAEARRGDPELEEQRGIGPAALLDPRQRHRR